MLAIRLQRVGRKGLPQYRVIVQESQLSPKSGRVVKYLGSYNPHTKEVKLDTDTAREFLSHGAQPSERVAHILKSEGVKLPAWVKLSEPQKRQTRNPEKLRRNQPAQTSESEVSAGESKPAESEAPAEETVAAESQPAKSEAPAEEPNPETAEAEPQPEAKAGEDKKDNESDKKA